MNKLSQSVFLLALAGMAGTANAELSGNLGFMSDYIFRGIPQSSTSAMGGIDFDSGGFYVGTWAADVGLGAEIDGYLGYGWEKGDFTYGVGATGYFYTDDFDDTYREINLTGGYQAVGLEVSLGEYDNFSGPTQDYSFVALSAEHKGFFGKIGIFGRDANGNYYELGYTTAVSGFDVGVSAINSDDDLLGGNSETNLVFTISKTFSIIE